MNPAKLSHLTVPVPTFTAPQFKAYVAPFREPLFGNHLDIALFDGVVYQQNERGIDPAGGVKALSWLRQGGTVLVLPGSAGLSEVEECLRECRVHQLHVHPLELKESEDPASMTAEPILPVPVSRIANRRPQIVDGVAVAPLTAFWTQKPASGGSALRPPPCACCR